MKRTHTIALALGLIIGCPAVSSAQDVTASTANHTELAAQAQNNLAEKILSAASLGSSFALPPGWEISSEDGATKVRFQLGKEQSDPTPSGFVFSKWSVGLESLLDVPDGPIKLSSLDGMARSSNVEFKFRRIGVRIEQNPAAAAAICKRARMIAKTEELGCHKAVGEFLPGELALFEQSVPTPVGPIRSWTVSAKVGTEKFEFVDAATLATRSDNKAPWSISLGYAAGSADARRLFLASASYQEVFEPQDEKSICKPGPAPQTCVTGRGGPPARTRKSLISAEYRQRISEDLAISALITYDAENDVSAAEIPIFIRGIVGDDLNAGLKFGWRSDTDEAVAAFFLNKPFSGRLFN